MTTDDRALSSALAFTKDAVRNGGQRTALYWNWLTSTAETWS